MASTKEQKNKTHLIAVVTNETLQENSLVQTETQVSLLQFRKNLLYRLKDWYKNSLVRQEQSMVS